MVDKKKVLIAGGVLGGAYLLLNKGGDSQKAGGTNFGNFTETKKAVGSSVPASTPLPSGGVPNITFIESALPSYQPSSESGGSSKKAVSSAPNENTANQNFSSGRINVGGGIYTNPNKNTAKNVFNTKIPSYTDGSGQGVSYVPKKTTTQPQPSTFTKIITAPTRLISPITRWFS